MEVGFFTMPIHPIDKDYKKTLSEDREAFLLADKIGFSEAYCGEHVTDAAENITSSALFIASLAAETKKIRLGTGTVNMPNSHPAAIAGQIALEATPDWTASFTFKAIPTSGTILITIQISWLQFWLQFELVG